MAGGSQDGGPKDVMTRGAMAECMVWEHTCDSYEEECGEWQDMFNRGDNLPTWEAPADLKHCNLKVLTIKGYQISMDEGGEGSDKGTDLRVEILVITFKNRI
ncbi:hypothetical protein C2845_PM16G12910 [Panicum miliaceum]|uniref:Uncharacterized protein n=1 Tax=Panicum miliaceum TaxID=4540 RepID=A0A3L6Q122_PANMI|nr:hypothetical protein C2845_PM16G12910 [Panicum miliaceum]